MTAVRWGVHRASLVVLAIAAGCYDPRVARGVQCGPNGECPAGQTCELTSNRCDGEPVGPVDAMVDVPPLPPDAAPGMFVDDFERPDSDALGNGWIEKTPTTWRIQDSVVRRIASATDYRDNLVYRPASEDIRDVEISVELAITALPPNFPQIFVRGQKGTIATADTYDGYLLFLIGDPAGTAAVIGRQRGNVFVETLTQFELTEEVTTGPRYRMTFRATGTNPVQLLGRFERAVPGGWTTIGQATATDAAMNRITGPGTVGFSGDNAATWTYDDFTRTPL